MNRLLFVIVITLSFCKVQSQNWMPLNTGLIAAPAMSCNPQVNAFTTYNNQLIIGGNFNVAGGNSTSNIAAWDGVSWSTLSSGLPNYYFGGVKALAVYNGTLIASGYDYSPTAQSIMKWNSTSWSNFASTNSNSITSTPSEVKALAIYNNNLIAAGSFTSIGGVTANNIAQWNGTSWSPLGTGISGFNLVHNGGGITGGINTLLVYNNELYAGGSFTIAGGTTVSNIAKWNGLNWSSVGIGIPACNIATSTMSYSPYWCYPYNGVGILCEYNNELYAGNCTNGIVKWNGTSWVALGGGLTNGGVNPTFIRGMAVYNGKLIVGGYFSSAGLTTAYNIAAWDGNNWSYVGGNSTNNGVDNYVNALTVYNNSLYAGGDVQNAHGASPVVPFNCVAMYTSTNCATTIDNTTNLVGTTLSSNQFGATYQWINCGTGNSNISGAINQTFTPVINGSYAVTVTYNGCTVTSSCTTISNVGIEEYQLINHVTVSPNPSIRQFNFTGLVGENTIQITDIMGRELITEKTFTEYHALKLDAAKGIYFYKITDKQSRVQQGKLIFN